MDRLQNLARRLLPLLVGVVLLAGAALYLAPRFSAQMPWGVAGMRPAAQQQAAAPQGAPLSPRAERPAPAQDGGPRADRRAPAQDGGPRAERPAPPAPRAAGPRPLHREPGHRLGWLWGWVLGSPRQWLSIGLIIAGLWFLGRRSAQRATPPAQAEPVHPETHQPAQEA